MAEKARRACTPGTAHKLELLSRTPACFPPAAVGALLGLVRPKTRPPLRPPLPSHTISRTALQRPRHSCFYYPPTPWRCRGRGRPCLLPDPCCKFYLHRWRRWRRLCFPRQANSNIPLLRKGSRGNPPGLPIRSIGSIRPDLRSPARSVTVDLGPRATALAGGCCCWWWCSGWLPRWAMAVRPSRRDEEECGAVPPPHYDPDISQPDRRNGGGRCDNGELSFKGGAFC